MITIDDVDLPTCDDTITTSVLEQCISDIKDAVMAAYADAAKLGEVFDNWDDPTFQMWVDNETFDWDWRDSLEQAENFLRTLPDGETAIVAWRVHEQLSEEVDTETRNLASFVVIDKDASIDRLLEDYNHFAYEGDDYYWRS